MKSKKGFTLVEMIVVLAIIAILISIAIPKLNKTKQQAEIIAHNGNVDMIRNAAILYVTNHQVDAGTNITQEVKNYLEGEEYPKIPPQASSNQWVVTVKANGDIVVSPGLIEQ